MVSTEHRNFIAPSDKFVFRHDSRNYHIPVSMPDPIRKRFGYGQLCPLRPACSQNRAVSYNTGSDFPHPFQFLFFFFFFFFFFFLSFVFFFSFFFFFFSSLFSSKKAWIVLCKTDPDPIWVAWSGSGQTQSGSKPVCTNHRAQFLTERNRPATSFPLSDSVPFFQRRPGQYCAKPARTWFSSG